MNRSEYVDEVGNDILDELEFDVKCGRINAPDGESEDEYLEYLYDCVFDDYYNSVTGNDSGSHSANRQKAIEDIGELVWDQDMLAELEVFYGEDASKVIERGPETFDVIVRMEVFPEAWEWASREFACRLFEGKEQ